MIDYYMPITPKSGLAVLVPCGDPKQRNGCIYHIELNPPRIGELPVKRLNPEKNLITDLKDPSLWDDHVRDTGDLIWRLDNDGRQGAVSALKKDPALKRDPGLRRQALKNPSSYLGALLASGLDGAHFVVWWNDQSSRLDVGIYCGAASNGRPVTNRRAANHALLVCRGLDSALVAQCKRCGQRFIQDEWHPREFCGQRCRNLFNVHKSRQRAKKRRKPRKAA